MSKVIEKEWREGDFNCKVIFMPLGHRCGYVGVPKGHHMYGLDYEKYTDEISLLAILSVLELYYNGPQDVDTSFPVFAVVI